MRGCDFRFFEKKLGKKLPCMAAARQSYSLIYIKNDWAATMQESFCYEAQRSFSRKATTRPPRPLASSASHR
jgi:hypothetical protein